MNRGRPKGGPKILVYMYMYVCMYVYIYIYIYTVTSRLSRYADYREDIHFLKDDMSFLRTRFLKKIPLIAKGPGLDPGPAGLTRGPGPGPAFTHSSILLLGFHQMTRVSSDIIHLSDI